MKGFFTVQNLKMKWLSATLSTLLLLVLFSSPDMVNAQTCAGATNDYGTYIATITPTCSSQTVSMPSTSYVQWTATAGVQYNFSLYGSGWPSNNMVVYYNNGSAWVPALSAVLSLSITPTSTNLAYNSTLLITAYEDMGCPPTWNTGSATLTYQIAPATTPAISDDALTAQCQGATVTYTASGITVGTFNHFVTTNSSTGTTNQTTNPYTWTANPPGSTETVYAQSNNGGCTANSSSLTLTVNAYSSLGSFVSTLYSCGSGSTYTTAGVLTAQSITGYTGTILGWGYGSTSGNCTANNTAYPTNAGNATCPWTTIPGNNTQLEVVVQNGACSPSSSCYPVVANTMTAPSTATITPSGPVCAPTSGNITLTYSGGGSTYLPATLHWYSGSCGGTSVGTGQSLVIAAPSSTTTYYCAWVDPCGTLTGCASANYTVTALPTVSAASYSICKNSTTTLSPSSGGTWASNNTAVATVSGNTVTGVGAGTATFTFTSSTAPYCANTTSAITVTALPSVSITGPTSFCGGTTTTLSPTSGGTWVSNNTAVATVSGYTVTGTTAGGSTNFTFTSSTSPNCANTTGNITVTGLPTVYGVTGGGTYCYGSSSVVGLAGSQTGVTYQLVLNGSTNVGSPVTGTGSAISFGGQTAVGTYTVVATTVTNSCSQAMSGNAVVTELTPNVTNSPGATSIGTNGATLNGTD